MRVRPTGTKELMVIRPEEECAPREKGGFVSPGRPAGAVRSYAALRYPMFALPNRFIRLSRSCGLFPTLLA